MFFNFRQCRAVDAIVILIDAVIGDIDFPVSQLDVVNFQIFI